MSRVEIYYPDDKFIPSDWPIKPQNKEICTVITNENVVTICQFRKNEKLIGDCFLCIDKSRYISWMFVDFWKPLGLPEDVNERILTEIEKWFEEDDDEE